MTNRPGGLVSGEAEASSLDPARDPDRIAINGAAMAAVLAAGIGSFAIGLFVILNEAGIFAAPSLYGPAGGVSGRTAFAAAAWLIAWFAVHRRWRDRRLDARRVLTATLILVALGLVLAFPPVWAIL